MTREVELIQDGSVCEDAHSYQDPNVQTASDARAKGKQRCPVFDECMYGNMLDRKQIRCAAKFGQQVARFTLEDGTDVGAEIETFKNEAFSPDNSVGHFGFIDPYENPTNEVTDPEKATEMVEDWANTIIYGPNT
jgi:hypothetical protein